MDFRFYFMLFLRRLHWFLLFLIIGSAIGLTLAKVLPAVYVSEARLLVESEQIPGDLASSTVRTQASEQIEIIQQRILTRDTLVDMANRLEIYGEDPGQARPPDDTDKLVEDMRDRISILTTGGGTQRGLVRATLMGVSFEAPSAQLAATVTNELVTLILREDVSMRTRVARQTLEFFEQEVDRLDKELADRGAVILSFKEENQEALPDSLEFRRTQQAANQERLLQVERQEAALIDRRNRMVRLHEAFGPNATTPEPALTAEQAQLQELENQLAGQLSVLSPENPRIKLLEARIEALREGVNTQAARSAGVTAGGQPLTAYEVELAEIDGELEFLADQKKVITDTLSDLRSSIEETPGNSITLETLERDYANVRVQYDQAVANKARAETGDIIEALRQGQRISIVEQAVVPAEPEKPNRMLIAAGGVSGGILLGLGMVFLLELTNKGIRRPADLTNALGITPFATLPYYRTRAERIRRRLIIFGILGFFLIGIPAGLWAIDTYIMPLDDVMDRLAGQVGLAGWLPLSPRSPV